MHLPLSVLFLSPFLPLSPPLFIYLSIYLSVCLLMNVGGSLASAFLEDSFLCLTARTIEEDMSSLSSVTDTLQDSSFRNQKAELCILPLEQGFG